MTKQDKKKLVVWIKNVCEQAYMHADAADPKRQHRVCIANKLDIIGRLAGEIHFELTRISL